MVLATLLVSVMKLQRPAILCRSPLPASLIPVMMELETVTSRSPTGNGLGGRRIDRRVGDRKLSVARQFLSEHRSQAAKRQHDSDRERNATIHVFLPRFRWNSSRSSVSRFLLARAGEPSLD